MNNKPTYGDISARFLGTDPEAETAQPEKRLTIPLPKKTCRNCGRVFEGKYPTCSFKCHQAYKATEAAIDEADKEPQEHPF